MKIHTVFITYNRLELTKQAIKSYLETVSVPFTFVIVDNASTDGTQHWFHRKIALSERLGVIDFPPGCGFLVLDENRYPGYAANRGWERAPADATHLHRADNDFVFLPGWCEKVHRRFKNPKVGQVGLRTNEEEEYALFNVGGNCMIRRELWDQGLRYDEKPWTEYPPGWSEDSYFSPAVVELGYEWTRVKGSCIIPISKEDPADPYYKKSWGDRRIYPS